MHFYSLKNQGDALFKKKFKKPFFVIRPLNTMLSFEVDMLYLQQIQHEMYHTGFPIDKKI